MAEYLLKLPDRKAGVAALSQMTGELSETFTEELLAALWSSHEAGDLPDDVVLVLRDWLARASFNASPTFHERLAEARKASGA